MAEVPDKVTLKDVYEIVARLEQKIEQNYVAKVEFLPVKSIVYGAASLILVSMLGILISYALGK